MALRKMWSERAGGVIEISVTDEMAGNARSALRRSGHRNNTIRCAEALNTPLWQRAILGEQPY